MNNKFNNPWNVNWIEMQKQYFDSASSFFQTNTTANPFNQNQLFQSMDSWWNANKLNQATDQFDLLNKMLTQGKSFYFLGQQLTQLLEALSVEKQTKKAWQNTLEQQIEMMKQGFVSQSDQFDERLAADWQTAQGAWQSMLNVLPGFSGINSGNMPDVDINEYIEKYLSIPGLGLHRELQEKLQRTIVSFKQYQENSEQFNSVMMEVAVKAMDLLKDKLLELSNSKVKLESLKQIYDLWVDCNEECYAEYTLTEDYSEKYGNMVNSLMVYKKHHSELMDEIYSSNNIPSKKDFDDLTRQQHVLKQQLKKSLDEKQHNEAKINKLEKELTGLRGATSGSSTTTKTTNATKKKKARKKAATKSKKKVSKKKSTSKKTTTKKNKPDQSNVIEIRF